MFPDSNIAKNFACGKTRCSYIVTFGLAPYFKGLLNDTLSSLDCFVAMFDESYKTRTIGFACSLLGYRK